MVGMGGSGRHTMTRLATYMQDYEIYEIEMHQDFTENDWYEFLREMLRKVALLDKPSTFLISDNQIINEKFLEDINNLLNIGEIPNLYPPDDKEGICAEIKEQAEKDNKKNLNQIQQWELFISKCRIKENP